MATAPQSLAALGALYNTIHASVRLVTLLFDDSYQTLRIKCKHWTKTPIDGEVNAIDFSSFFLQYFQRSSVKRVFIFTSQTEAGPKRPFRELSESPTPSAVALDAAD